jgi:hypothetical protein
MVEFGEVAPDEGRKPDDDPRVRVRAGDRGWRQVTNEGALMASAFPDYGFGQQETYATTVPSWRKTHARGPTPVNQDRQPVDIGPMRESPTGFSAAVWRRVLDHLRPLSILRCATTRTEMATSASRLQIRPWQVKLRLHLEPSVTLEKNSSNMA